MSELEWALILGVAVLVLGIGAAVAALLSLGNTLGQVFEAFYKR